MGSYLIRIQHMCVYIYIYISVSLSLSRSLSLSLFLHFSFSLSLSLDFCLSFFLSLSLSLCVSTYIYIYAVKRNLLLDGRIHFRAATLRNCCPQLRLRLGKEKQSVVGSSRKSHGTSIQLQSKFRPGT